MLTQHTHIAFALADITRLVRAMFNARMRALGLNGSTWRALAYLYREDGQTQAQLARHLDVSRAAVGQMIDGLKPVATSNDATIKATADLGVSTHCANALRGSGADRGNARGGSERFAGLAEDEINHLGALVGRLREHLMATQPVANAMDAKRWRPRPPPSLDRFKKQ
ncbi:MAG: MarR family transcriptional regulator [Hyphomonadaceae bacterium]|nr:MarR family transcriptional regulator [Hyphomonadaceae bacterium]